MRGRILRRLRTRQATWLPIAAGRSLPVRTRRATLLATTPIGRHWLSRAVQALRVRRVRLALRELRVRLVQLALRVLLGLRERLQPLLLVRSVLLLTLELRALLTVAVLALPRLILFCVTGQLVRKALLALRVLLAPKGRRAILGRLVLKDHRVPLVLRVHKVRLVLLARKARKGQRAPAALQGI